MTTRIYIQSEHLSEVKLVQMDDNATLDEVKRAAIALLPPGTDANELTLSVEDDDDDRHQHAKHLKDICKDHGIRVHLHRCKQIHVEVQFAGKTVKHDYRPATTIATVRDRAGRALGMQPGDISEHVLQVSGTNFQPDLDVHIGALTKRPACGVSFDLVPAHRVNG